MSTLIAQNTARISGYLKDANSGEPIMFANVIIDDTYIGAASDNFGYYVIPNGMLIHYYWMIIWT